MYKISIKGLTLCMRIKITILYKGKNMFKVGCCSKVYTSYFEHVSTSYRYPVYDSPIVFTSAKSNLI